ncbi:hypothetical protein [Flagellimonas beolgyonensis]
MFSAIFAASFKVSSALSNLFSWRYWLNS